MSSSSRSLQRALSALVQGRVTPATEADCVAGVTPQVVVMPETEQGVAAVLAFADRERLKVLVRGRGTHLGIGSPPTGGNILLSTRALNQIIAHAPHDQTLSVEAGRSLGEVQASLARTHQWLALDPLSTPGATIGGLIAANVSGPRRLRYGGVRDQIIGVRVALPDGTLVTGGGTVVKNVAGYDLPKLYCGSLGTLGVIVAATFRLYPLAVASRTVTVTSPDISQLGDLVLRVTGSQLVPAAIDLVSPSAPSEPSTLAVVFEAGSNLAAEEQTVELAALAHGLGLSAQTLQREEEDGLWERFGASLRELPGAPSLLLRVNVPPTKVISWLTSLAEYVQQAAAGVGWRAHAGHGTITVRLSGASEMLADVVGPLRQAALRCQGSLVVTEAPSSLAAKVDMWGPSSALTVMRSLKDRFDPHGTLNPGRFVGGI